MILSRFLDEINFTEMTEVEKIKQIAFYYNATEKTNVFSVSHLLQVLKDIGHPVSNISRLRKNLSISRNFKKIENDIYILVPMVRQKLEQKYGNLFNNEEEISSSSEVLDESLFLGKRGFLDILIKQVNNCYSNNCFDACAVLLRRIFEITLILAYENKGVQIDIKDSNGDYYTLEKIVTNAVNNTSLHISRSRREYDSIRDLGNFAAHKIHYNTRKTDIDNIKQTFRVCLEELYYIAGLKI